jgi:hypothetical protein
VLAVSQDLSLGKAAQVASAVCRQTVIAREGRGCLLKYKRWGRL